jgi:hypothetical protein
MVARIPGSHWVTVERGGHIFVHNDEHALAEIAAFVHGTNGLYEPRTRGGRPAQRRRMSGP